MLSKIRALGFTAKLALLGAVALLVLGVALLVPPFAQPAAYHNFADRDVMFGVPHFGDVVSNGGFLIVGVAGIVFMFSRLGQARLADSMLRWPFGVFFAGLALVALGSAYYHWNPNNQTLFWDRLAMTVAFMALLAAFFADRVSSKIGAAIVLPLLLILGAAAALHWRFSEIAGHGDLRFYFLAQALPMILIPLICLLFPGRLTHGRYLLYLGLWYAGAVALEQLDHQINAMLGGVVSGHSLKHLAAAMATFMVLRMLQQRPTSRRPAN